MRPLSLDLFRQSSSQVSTNTSASCALARDTGREFVTFGHTLSHQVSEKLIRNVVRV